MKDIGKLHGLELSPSSYFLFILLHYGKNENVYSFFRIRKCKKKIISLKIGIFSKFYIKLLQIQRPLSQFIQIYII